MSFENIDKKVTKIIASDFSLQLNGYNKDEVNMVLKQIQTYIELMRQSYQELQDDNLDKFHKISQLQKVIEGKDFEIKKYTDLLKECQDKNEY
ncbi:hypothetical protein V2E24_02170 [Mycoplasmopsis ciconiae]|uniref:DivIVA domain-containing protein n=1 Tax=Mycoplasmopsis ciconiae TaxID=561067 RepID=A0ABU7MLG3_9BACT|nr:hypothetical protein [Mycoplasmopsis ciconiae]